MKILMVCLGNICRSPMAQGILESMIHQNKLDWFVDSAGTGTWHIGEKPDSRSIQTAKRNGILISHQRARQFRAEDFDQFDQILTMDTGNYNEIMSQARNPQDRDKIKLILNYVHPGENRSVPDPYLEGGFDRVFRILYEACEKITQAHVAQSDQ